MRDPYASLRRLLLPAATLTLAGCIGTQEGSGCMEVAGDALECPPASEVHPDQLFGDCGSTIKSIQGEGTLGPNYWSTWYYGGSGTDTVPEGQLCCYPVVETQATCVYGRPYVEEGDPQLAPTRNTGAWRAGPAGLSQPLPAQVRAQLAQAWTEAALDEHAAIAAFARVALELMSFGAPPELLDATHQAARDEVLHAQLGFALASVYAGEDVGPAGFPFQGRVALSESLVELAVAAAREGCIGETLTTLVAAETLAHTTDPGAQAVLGRIVSDEQRHAALAWKTVRWAIDVGGEPVRSAVLAVFHTLERDGMPLPARLADGPHRSLLVAHGVPDADIARKALTRGIHEVVLPAARALLGTAAQVRAVPEPAAPAP